MTRKLIISAIIGAGLLTSAALATTDSAAPVTTQVPDSVSTQATVINQNLIAYNQSYNRIVENYDMDGFLGLYAENPLWIAPTKAPVAGLDVPRNTFGFISQKKGTLTHTADHTFLSKDGSQAILIGRYDVAIEAVGSKGTGTYLFVLKREGEDWKIVVDMFNEHDDEAN